MRKSGRKNKLRPSKISVTDFQVSLGFERETIAIKLNLVAEEFNKYLSYVRNLGFEDTPDYDYLRDLFTQALKNTGEVEDGEYDWMKLNNGKGWEAMKQHPSHNHLHPANPQHNTASAKALAGGADTQRGPATPGALRIKNEQPLPPSPKPGVGKTRGGPGAPGAALPKRPSGVAGGLTDMATPTPSNIAQFRNSTADLAHRASQINPGTTQQSAMQQIPRQQNQDPPPSTLQKIMKALCCSR